MKSIRSKVEAYYNKLRRFRFPVAINYFLNEMRDLWQIHVKNIVVVILLLFCCSYWEHKKVTHTHAYIHSSPDTYTIISTHIHSYHDTCTIQLRLKTLY